MHADPHHVAAIRRLIAAAQGRADRAGLLADRYQQHVTGASGTQRDLYLRMGAVQRGSQERHLAVVELHERYLLAVRHDNCANHPVEAGSGRFVHVLADQLGVVDLGITLFAHGQWVAATGTSPRIRAAQDLEFVLAEGPVHDATDNVVSADTAESIRGKWPRFGAALTAMSAQSVTAAPIAPDGHRLGALMVLDVPPKLASKSAIRQLAGAVELTLMLTQNSIEPDGEPRFAHPLLDDAGDFARIHQAAGIVSVRQHCSVRDALDLLRARAYVEGTSTAAVADQVLRHETELD